MMKWIIIIFLVSFPCLSNELRFYILPSPHGMDWSSPKNLLVSAIKNKLTFEKRFIGHVSVEIQCKLPNQEPWSMMEGMRSPKFDVLNQLFIHGIGLGILFHSFEGDFETKELHEEMKALTEKKGSIVKYKITAEQCLRLKTYIEEFKKYNIQKTYGLAHRPLAGEGAGCTAFAASFIKVLGIYDSNLDMEWGIRLKIPLKLSGAPLTNNYRNIFTIYQEDHWDQNTEGKDIFFYDPDKMHQWVKKMRQENPDKKIDHHGIELDLTLIPIPKGPIFEQSLEN